MDKKPETPAYLASPASTAEIGAERVPTMPGAILQKAATLRSEPSPAAAEPLPLSAPLVDDYLDDPDDPDTSGRWERIGNERMEASPATSDHGDPHFELDALIKAHLAEGWVGSTDLKTRVNKKQEYASDTCVRREGIDPDTGSRYLEELVFEVVHKRSAKKTKERARGFAACGVRRQIGIFVKQKKIREWQKSEKDWGEPLDLEQSLEDKCMAVALPLAPLFDSALSQVAIVRAYEAKDHPAILEIKEKSEKKGEEKGEEKGEKRGEEIGLIKGLRRNLEDLCEILEIEMTKPRREALARADLAALEALREKIKQTRRWDEQEPRQLRF
jgi:hypothetical protein